MIDFYDAIAENKKAQLYYNQGNLREAIALCYKIIKIYPDFVDVYKTLGNVLQVHGNRNAAIRAYVKATEIQLNNGLSYSQLSQSLVSKYGSQIWQLVSDNPGQMSFSEYIYITNVVGQKVPGNFLIFGVGKDTQLWLQVNDGGKTIFLEDNQEWLTKIKSSYKNFFEAYLVEYNTRVSQWKDLLREYSEGNDCLSMVLPEKILLTNWDFILVDAPAGYSEEKPGRMKSIYTAAKLARQTGTRIFIHDCDRSVENIYSNYFLGKNNLINQVNKLQHYYLK
ncbi:MAG: TIGR01627 domain-containing protein [Okeania sp. SIO2F4]|uniref:TIGR01627 domain-containing protein n=1 Tax=Okeania sp. SIO2F4 TaxID=2607790 RepID=UPI0014292902|nr:TIGR01627 domain-containing protein [Okeania sp. SIO2F4]NES01604.1 TIGR01627 domain-containing protein [Okeania sp. SIO2F4]